MKRLLLHYWPELILTLVIWAVIGWKLGVSAFIVTVILSVLEITLSADNAVVNSRVLVKMSVFWQRLFMTVGILIAVFAVRFALPILLVAIAASLDVGVVLNLAINNPEEYGHKLHDIAHIIDAFGGIFLMLVAVFFFIDHGKKVHWLRIPEQLFVQSKKSTLIRALVTGSVFAGILLVVDDSVRIPVGLAMAVAVGVFCLLHAATYFMEKVESKNALKKQVGWVAFISFMYLEVLDASFSLDGVVGAFALTNNIVIIMAGLGIGALWVRTMTIYLVRHNTLVQYRYLESGAHWAILALSFVMILKLLGIELPELVVGSIGLIFITAAMIGSIRINKRAKKTPRI